MTVFAAHVENGEVVLDTSMSLPDGARLRVELVENETAQADGEDGKSLSSWLLSYAGTVHGLPSDMAAQHDHYIYGTPKK